MSKKNEMPKKEVVIFGKGLHAIIDEMANNGIKAMDQLIEHSETGKRYCLTINEVIR